MPLIEASFKKADGHSDDGALQASGPTIQVSVCTMFTGNPADMKCELVTALVDTGACKSMIDEELAVKLGLVVVDKANCIGIGGGSVHSIYMAGIIIPHLDYQQFGQFMSAPLKKSGNPQHVLLGRDFLSNTVMIYDGIRAQVTIASKKN